jgi:hypothetical protein
MEDIRKRKMTIQIEVKFNDSRISESVYVKTPSVDLMEVARNYLASLGYPKGTLFRIISAK